MKQSISSLHALLVICQTLEAQERLEEELDEDIYPVTTYVMDYRLVSRRVDVPRMVIEREDKRKDLLTQLNFLREEYGELFEFLNTLSMREAQALQCIAVGKSLPQGTEEYTQEVINNVQRKLNAFQEEQRHYQA